jgi:hypothetical protein
VFCNGLGNDILKLSKEYLESGNFVLIPDVEDVEINFP